MDIRDAIHPDHAGTLGTQGLRREFLISDLFAPDLLNMTYCHTDRVIVIGVSPVAAAVELSGDLSSVTGTDFFLERRELGVINIGAPGRIFVDGEAIDIDYQEGLYIGAGVRDVRFESVSPDNPAKFYGCSTPAHTPYPVKKVTLEDAAPKRLGDTAQSNKRTIYQYIHPDIMPSCQLLMGLTRLEPGSVWNTMPCHTHERRMEVYFYFDVADDAAVFHMMGRPDETRHLTMRNEQAAISPSWSIHTGVGTAAYGFIWAMAGENQAFDDMDFVETADLR